MKSFISCFLYGSEFQMCILLEECAVMYLFFSIHIRPRQCLMYVQAIYFSMSNNTVGYGQGQAGKSHIHPGHPIYPQQILEPRTTLFVVWPSHRKGLNPKAGAMKNN